MKYFKLGKHASVFHDQRSGFNIANKQVGCIDDKKVTKKINDAVGNGHLVNATEAEFQAFEESKAKPATLAAAPAKTEADEQAEERAELEGKNVTELRAHAVDTLDGLTEDQIKDISKMKKDDLINFILNW